MVPENKTVVLTGHAELFTPKPSTPAPSPPPRPRPHPVLTLSVAARTAFLSRLSLQVYCRVSLENVLIRDVLPLCFFSLYALVFYVYCRVIPDVLSLMFFHVPPLGFLK